MASSTILRAIYVPVFHPGRLTGLEEEYALVLRSGWVLIAVRWLYYSVVFALFRDYQGRWAPFQPPPFGLEVEQYAPWQKLLALPFGFLLMGAMGLAVAAYLRHRRKGMPPPQVLNIMGATYFLPFVILQLFDLVVLLSLGWKLLPVAVAHTAVLSWESWAAATVISSTRNLSVAEKRACIALQMAVWILLAGVVWR